MFPFVILGMSIANISSSVKKYTQCCKKKKENGEGLSESGKDQNRNKNWVCL